MTLAPAPERLGMSMEEFLRRSAAEGDFELINGEKIERMSTVFGHGAIANFIALLLNMFAIPKQLGKAYVEMSFVIPGQESGNWVVGSRIPDVSFYAQARLEAYHSVTPDSQHKPLALLPDLVIEVLSPNDKYAEITAKVDLYLRDGVSLIWVVDLDAQTVVVHAPGQPPVILRGTDTLTAGDLLPGFSTAVSDLFSPSA